MKEFMTLLEDLQKLGINLRITFGERGLNLGDGLTVSAYMYDVNGEKYIFEQEFSNDDISDLDDTGLCSLIRRLASDAVEWTKIEIPVEVIDRNSTLNEPILVGDLIKNMINKGYEHRSVADILEIPETTVRLLNGDEEEQLWIF